MKKTLVVCLILAGIICSERSIGQSLSTEVTGMEAAWAFSGSFNTMMSKTSKISFSNTSRFSSDYMGEEDMHMLIMTNFGYALTPKLKSTIGEIYTDGGGLKPSIGLQYVVSKKHFLTVIFPNLNIAKQSDLMVIFMSQYLRNISEKVMFVLRLQSLGLANSDGHIFSTLRFRSGFIRGKYQFGAASDLNFSGNEFEFARSFGLFLQYQLF